MGDRVLINKDVNNERWAITYNLDDDTVTGNVYFEGGEPPAFFDCTNISPEDPSLVNLQCFLSYSGCGASSPTLATCPQSGEWKAISATPLFRSFFGLSTCYNGIIEPEEDCEEPDDTYLGACPGQPDKDAICVRCDRVCVTPTCWDGSPPPCGPRP
jgi:hypothetical protein